MRMPWRREERESSEAVRGLLLGLVLFGSVGLLLELSLLEHTESLTQAIPFAVLGGGFASGIAVAVRPTHAIVRVFQATMMLLVVTGTFGLVLHLRGNVAFEQELDASVHGLALLWRSLRGATPALAPGALAQLGLLGLIQAYRHPALSRPSPESARLVP